MHNEGGKYTAFIDGDRDGAIPGNPARLLIWRHHIIEDLFMCCDEGRCQGYRQAGHGVEPVLTHASEGWAGQFVVAWHTSVLDFARAWKGTHRKMDDGLLENVALENSEDFLRAPPRNWVECFLGVDLSIDVMGSGRVPLVKRMNLREMAMEQNWAGSDAVLGRCVSYWPEGSLAISGKWVKALAWAKRHGWRKAVGRALQG